MQSIRAKVTLFICLLLLMVFGAYAALVYHEMHASATSAAGERLGGASADIAAMLAGSSEQRWMRAAAAAESPDLVGYLRGSPSADESSAVEALRATAPDNVAQAELRDSAGRPLLETVVAAEDRITPPERVRAPAAAEVTPLFLDDHGPAYGAVAPVEADGAVIGYVVHWRRLQTDERSRELIIRLIGAEATVYLANASGTVWTDLRDAVAPRGIQPSAMIDGRTYERPGGGRVLSAASLVPGTPWAIVVELPRQTVLAGPRATLNRLALLGLLILLLAGAAAWALSGRLTASITAVADAAGAISGGDYSRRAAVRGRDEIAKLGAAFNRMAQNVAAAQDELEQKVNELAVSEAQHRETHERLEHVIASSRAILFTYRPDESHRTFDWISENVERLLGYTSQQASEPEWWSRAIHPEDRRRVTERLSQWSAGENLTLEYRLRRADDVYRWIHDERRCDAGHAGRGREVVGVLTDVTDHRHLEGAKQAAEAANKAKNDFLSRMSHELRTPMNAVLGFAQLLVLDARTDENREGAEQIVKAGKHLLGLIDEVLDISRIEAGRMSMSTEPVSVARVLRESTDLVQMTAEEHEVSIDADEACTTDLYVQADQQRLKQVLLNLLSNAIKYNRRGGSVTVACEMLSHEHDAVQIVVRDTGYGIPSDRLEALFTPFERLGAEETAVEGTGLGLALSRGLIQAMQGRLGVASREGVGSEFWIQLPRTRRPNIVPTEPVERDESAVAGDAPRRTVLFIEDNLANVRLMERVFRRRPQARLITAMQGSIGLDLAREHRPDLILLDLNLPDLSGEVVLRRIRQDPELRDTPVVMVSGDAIPSQATRMRKLGARAYLTKPFDLHALLAEVDAAISDSEVRA